MKRKHPTDEGRMLEYKGDEAQREDATLRDMRRILGKNPNMPAEGNFSRQLPPATRPRNAVCGHAEAAA